MTEREPVLTKETSETLLEQIVDWSRSIRTARLDCHVVLRQEALCFLFKLDGKLAGIGVRLDVLDEQNLEVIKKALLDFVAGYFKQEKHNAG